MATPGDVIDVPELGVKVEFRATNGSTGGEYTEVDVVGRARGFIRLTHVHVGVTEHHTVIEGSMRVKLRGKIHVLRAGRDGVRLGVVAPASLPVHRHEVYQQICESNRAAATPDPADPERRAAIEAELNSRLP